MDKNAAGIRTVFAVMLGLMLIVAGVRGNPGSILGAIINASNMQAVPSQTGGG